MKTHHILVYMATYNGENYIREQLDSILSQEGVHVDILIADDSSSDSTCQIIESYHPPDITLIHNPANKGYRKNFMDLIKLPLVREYDYFALSDQDDYWQPDKLAAAIRALDCCDHDKPALYCSNLMPADQNLVPFEVPMNPPVSHDVHHFLLQNICTGCTAVFNAALRELLLRFPDEKLIVPHDTIISRIALLCGNFIYDDTPRILYRQHGRNAIGVNTSGKLQKYWKAVQTRQNFHHSENLNDLCHLYGNLIHPELKVWLQPILNYKTSYKSAWTLLSDKTYRKGSLSGTLIFKAAVLLKSY